MKKMIQIIRKQWFLFALVVAFLAVVIDPTDILVRFGLFLKACHTPDIMIFSIFIISGLLIDSKQIMAGIKDMKATFIALAVILIIAPLSALGLSMLPLETGTVVGLFIAAVMPTTLSSGIVMSQTAGGNMAHALFITIISNFICIFSIPLILPFLLSFLGQEKDLPLDQTAMMIKLIVIVLIPLAFGMFAKAKLFRKRVLPNVKMQQLNQWMIVCIVFISMAGSKGALTENGKAFFYIMLLSIVFHLMLLGSSFFLVKLFGIPRGRYESVIFMGSQKTLALSAMLQVTYFSEFATALLFCVVHHIIHLMMDGYLCTAMGRSKPAENRV